MRLLRKLQARYRNIRLLTTAAVLLILASAIPWYWSGVLNEGQTLMGLPLSYFFSLFLMPAAILVLLVIFGYLAEDVDRYNVEFENE